MQLLYDNDNDTLISFSFTCFKKSENDDKLTERTTDTTMREQQQLVRYSVQEGKLKISTKWKKITAHKTTTKL